MVFVYLISKAMLDRGYRTRERAALMKDSRDLDQRIFAEQVVLLFKQYPLSALSGFLVSWVVAFVLWNQVPYKFITTWLVLQNLLLVAGFGLVWLANSTYREKFGELTLFRTYLIIITVIGMLWGSLALFLDYMPSNADQMFLVITITGLASAALVLAIPVLSAYYSYLCFALSPLIFWFLKQDQSEFTALATLAIFFLSLLLFAGTSLHRHLVNTIRLRYENEDLIKEIQQLNRNLEKRVKEKTQELFESEERFNLAMQGANDGLWDIDLVNNDVYFSPRWKAMLGYEDNEIKSAVKEWVKRLHPEDKRNAVSLIREHLAGETESYESIHRIRHKNGQYLWVLDRGRAVRDGKGKVIRIVGTQVDISEQKALEERFKSANIKLKHEAKERQIAQGELAYLATHDPLTKLPNRNLFYKQLSKALRKAELEGEAIAVLLVDLDNFKHVNDTLGHTVGDVLLKDVSGRLTSIVNRNYFLSRFGGDEFLVILEGCSDTFIVDAYAREIIELLSKPFYLENHEIRIGCSIGITIYPDHGVEPDVLIRDADIAMYHAKDEGRNTYKYFTGEMDKKISENVKLRNLLHGALERKELEVVYQPQVDLRNGETTGIEALLRWQNDDVGSVSPERFIPMLEESGLIGNVGYWVLENACLQAKSLIRQGLRNFKIAVNFSPYQFTEASILPRIAEILRQTDLNPGYLEIEITENVFMKDLALVDQVLVGLKEMGITITLDDFGTGFSSLEYLKRFPIDGLKIDKAFIKDIDNEGRSRELVAAIIAMGKSLNMRSMIAEGVETKEQLKILREIGCRTYQGYLFSKPLNTESLENLVIRGVRHLTV